MAPPARSHSPPLPPQAVFKHDSLSLALRPDRLLYLAGSNINGVLELSCSSDKAWLGRIALDLRGAEYLESLDHAASQTFLNAEVTFQSSSLPPSNAVLATSPSSSGYWPARSGVTRFSFSFPLPTTSPTSCRFANNASIKYTLTATVQVQYKGERQILTKRLDVQVVERWTDWQDEQFREPAEAQKRVRASASGGAFNLLNSAAGSSAEGSIWVEARIQEPLFYRGYDLPGGGVEKERSKGTVGFIFSVKNATSRTLSSGIKLSLLRRLKILPGEGNTSSSEDLRPRITEEVEHVSLNGREWEFPAVGEERIVHCGIDLPKQDRYLSIRKTKLFEVHTFLKVTLGMGALTKDIDLELPIWVAHYASLPREAFKPRSIPVPGSIPLDASALSSRNGAISPYGRSPSVIPPLQQQFPQGYFPLQNTAQQSFFSSWPTGQAPVSPATSPIPFASPRALQAQSQQQYIAFDANAPDLTQSRFFAHLGQPNLGPAYHPGPGMQRSNSAMAFSAPSLPPVSQSYSSQSPARYHQGGEATLHTQQFASIPRSMSADPYRAGPSTPDRPLANGSNNVSPGWQRTLSPGILEFLSPEEQQRVLANSAPASYDAAARAHQQPRQPGAPRSPDRSPSRSPASAAVAGRRQSMPSPSIYAAPIQQRSNSFSPDATGQYISNGSNRPIKTPPLAPSSRFTPPTTTGLHEQSLTTTIQGLPPLINSGLETIGEDGESQAGTLRFKTLPRSLSFDNDAAGVSSPSARGGSQISIKSVKAVHAPGRNMDDEGNTSVSLLEEMVDRQDREKEAAAAVAAAAIGELKAEELDMRELLARSGQQKALMDLDGADKSLPKPPVPSSKESKTPSTSTTKPNIRNIFTASSSTIQQQGQTVASPTKPHVSPTRRVSQPLVPSIPMPSKPLIKPSNSDSLLALESRLSSSSRPTSPISPTSPLPESAAADLSGVVRSMTLSPAPGRAISPAPLHVGNAGALRKKRGQISLKRQQSAISLASLPGAAEKTLPSTLVDVKSPPIAKARIAESNVKSPIASKEAPITTISSADAATSTMAFGNAAASKAKEAAARVRKSLDSSSASLAAATRQEWSRASKVESAEGEPVKRQVPVRSREEKVSSPVIRRAKEIGTPVRATAVKKGSPQLPQPPKPFFAQPPPNTTASARSSPPPGKAIATSPIRTSLSEKALPKRLVSDPSHSPKRSVSPALIERTNQASRRRHSVEPDQLGISPDTDKYGSMRGGRGGQVTDVAKQWATLIAAGKSQPATQAFIDDREKKVVQPEKRVSSAKQPESNGSKKPAATTHRLTVGGGRGGGLAASKAAPAKTFTNATIGKSPVFSKSLPTQATVAPVTRSISDHEGNSKKEQAQGPGSDRLKALISKFS